MLLANNASTVLAKTNQRIKRAICMHLHFEILIHAILDTYSKGINYTKINKKPQENKNHCFFFEKSIFISFM